MVDRCRVGRLQDEVLFAVEGEHLGEGEHMARDKHLHVTWVISGVK